MRNSGSISGDDKYISAVDGLRAVAVLAVIINHFNTHILPSGYLGVDIFFVISGFVITLSLLSATYTSVWSALAAFYARRFKRLVPALVLVTIVGFCLIKLFDPDPIKSVQTGMMALFGAGNLYLYALSVDYFSQNTQLNPFMHMWSLGVEEQFYLLFPIIILITPVARFRWWIISFLSGLSLLGFVLVYRISQPAAYFLIPFRFWELSAGCMLALCAVGGHLGVRGCQSGHQLWIPLVLLCAILMAPESHPVATTFAIVVMSCAVIVTIWRVDSAGNPLATPILLLIGRLSYSLYLWHWIVICIGRWTVGVSLYTFPFEIVAIVVLSVLSYGCVELPLRRRIWFKRNMFTAFTGLALVSSAAAIIYFANAHGIPRFSGSFASAKSTDVGMINGYRGRYTQRRMEDCAGHVVYSDSPQVQAQRLTKCTVSLDSSKVNLLFIGDSHALDLFPIGDLLIRDHVANVTNLYETSCQLPPPSNVDSRCQYLMKYIYNLPIVKPNSHIVIIRNNLSPKRLDGHLWSYESALESVVKSLVSRGYQVVYFAPSPKYPSIGPGALCTIQWYRPSWALPDRCQSGFTEPRSVQIDRRSDFFQYLTELQERQTGFHVFDPFPVLCGESAVTCSPERNGHLIYRDESHLTEQGAGLLYAPFRQCLSANGWIS